MIITLTISYQFQTLIQRIDTEFDCGSRGMVLKYVFMRNIEKPYHENRNKILDRFVVLMCEIDMKSLKL